MAQPVNPMVIDLSHWDPADDYSAVMDDGIHGVIYKATQGTSYTDDTYVSQRSAARAAGLKWGAYHFADSSNTQSQIDNFMRFAAPDPDELFCLDWEDNGGAKMSRSQAEQWIQGVEDRLGRPNQCVVYGGNTIKEAIPNSPNEFWSARRLWLCQYSDSASWPTEVWPVYWLWQFTDGQYGPGPHSINGVGNCDVNSYRNGPPEQLEAEWATGQSEPTPPEPTPTPDAGECTVVVATTPGVLVKVRQVVLTPQQMQTTRDAFKRMRAKEAGK